MRIRTVSDFEKALSDFTPYVKVFLCADGGSLCEACARKEKEIILENTALGSRANGAAADWLVRGVDVLEEHNGETCDHCSKEIYPDESGKVA
jgi:hypothetical protein